MMLATYTVVRGATLLITASSSAICPIMSAAAAAAVG